MIARGLLPGSVLTDFDIAELIAAEIVNRRMVHRVAYCRVTDSRPDGTPTVIDVWIYEVRAGQVQICIPADQIEFVNEWPVLRSEVNLTADGEPIAIVPFRAELMDGGFSAIHGELAFVRYEVQ